MADASPVAPAAPVAATPKPDAAAPAPDARELELKAREEALAKREKVWRDEAKKASDEKKGLGAKLKEYEELRKWRSEKEREEQLANLNPTEFAKKKWGDGWYDKLMQAHTNGVPPADLIAAELSKMRVEFEARLAERDEAANRATTEAKQRSVEEARQQVASECAEYFEASKAEYPLLETYGDAKALGAALGRHIEAEFQRTGKLMSAKEAADKLEASEAARLEKAAAHEKYKTRLQEKLKPATIPSAASGAPRRTEAAERRTLSNNLTASTPGRAPPASPEERLKRATEAYEAAAGRSKAG